MLRRPIYRSPACGRCGPLSDDDKQYRCARHTSMHAANIGFGVLVSSPVASPGFVARRGNWGKALNSVMGHSRRTSGPDAAVV